jgi:predicted esterase
LRAGIDRPTLEAMALEGLSILKRAVIAGLFAFQPACSACRVRPDEPSKYDVLLAKNGQADISKPKTASSHRRAIEHIELSLRDGTQHTAVLSFPERSRAPLPVIVVLAGFETGAEALGLLRPDVNAIYVATDYPYKAPNERGVVKDLRELPAIKKAILRTDLALDALIEKLRRDPRVDARKITVVGASFGAPFAITAAVRNPAITGVILIHAFGRVDLAFAEQLMNEWGRWSYPFAWSLGKLAWGYLGYEAPEDEARKLKPHQHVFYIHADADEQLPCESIVSLQDALAKSQAQVTTARSQGGHLGPGKMQMIDALMAVSLEWLKDHRLLNRKDSPDRQRSRSE